jgi:hypothetical protein
VPRQEIILPDHVLPAFGGKLLGTDRGEWVGKLMFQDEAGNLKTILNENVHGIVENSAGIFVFTGLSHLTLNEGYIYIIDQGANEDVGAALLGRLPGAPHQVTQVRDGSTSFLVFSGFKDDHQYFECYALIGKIFSHSNACLPPKPLGANNSFKPKPLRGSA